MKRFLAELEARMAALPPAQRAELAAYYTHMISAIVVGTKGIGQHFKPSKGAGLALIWELVGALGNGAAFLSKLKTLAAKTGPNVNGLVSTL
jgi:hypothetical protein